MIFNLIACSFCIGSIIGNYDLSCNISNSLDNNVATQFVYNDDDKTITYNDICILKYYNDTYDLHDLLVGVLFETDGDTVLTIDNNYNINNLNLITFTYTAITTEYEATYVDIYYQLDINFKFGASSSRAQTLTCYYGYRATYQNYNYSNYDNYLTYPFYYSYSIPISNTDYQIGYNDGYSEGYDTGYYYGSNDLRDVWNGDFIGWLGSAVGGFFAFEIFPGFTLGGAIGAVIAAYLMVWLLRVFAGG